MGMGKDKDGDSSVGWDRGVNWDKGTLSEEV